jgi:putative zinc finger/helix-turn-helix YgiT family protein
MIGFCPQCELDRELSVVLNSIEYDIKGEKISIETRLNQCATCKNEFIPPDEDADPLELAFREYRQRHGMLQPEEIRNFRQSLGLNQKELSGLLSWGGATLSRYETGGLQDDAHDTALRMAMNPGSMLSLIEKKPSILSPEKTCAVREALGKYSEEQALPFRSICESRLGLYGPDEYNGYRKFDINKLFNTILFFCMNSEVVKTKLNKLLFYADFKHFKEYTVSITGARYAHLPYGPAPDGYPFILAALEEEEKTIVVEERSFGSYLGEVLIARKSTDISVFLTSELKILSMVKEMFGEVTAKQLSDRSHKEKAFVETKNGELIAYTLAEELSI